MPDNITKYKCNTIDQKLPYLSLSRIPLPLPLLSLLPLLSVSLLPLSGRQLSVSGLDVVSASLLLVNLNLSSISIIVKLLVNWTIGDHDGGKRKHRKELREDGKEGGIAKTKNREIRGRRISKKKRKERTRLWSSARRRFS